MATAIRDTSRPILWLILAVEMSVLAVGFVGVGTALPQVSVPIGKKLVARDLQPFGQDLSVGITLSLIGAIAVGGSVVLARLRVWWAVVMVLATALVIGFVFLSLAGFMVSGVFI